ncbi:FAD-dependent oxidoreductase [Xanthobacteraceae bacterium Astr-EGSB]|uniref:FAD-dependent oxidoreductase n=1 Tax=Astrobacterium formosum TaxID=3069710 RepID=UPI0027AE8478|nr:FAD-dependent oxidoreductase [Xanthobacteraceae bacterium Astr-EGSB]
MDYDALIVGGGIAGMQSALTLGDMGYRVLLVEKEPSIGGRMILLSKVFPTLDCASCISTPKMATTAHHPNITVMTSADIDGIERDTDGSFIARVRKKSTFVDPTACIGCAECERECTVAIADRFNFDLIASRAIHIAFPQAVPKKAVIASDGISPCTYTCPGGVEAHGYVSLVRAGLYEEAFRLHMKDAPLPGSLSRLCYAPCEKQCTRALAEGKIEIRGAKRFMTDYYYDRHPVPEYGVPADRNGKRVAVVGSGPAGLTAAYFLARNGYAVTIFESAREAGGVLRDATPPYRLPRAVLERDLHNITALGVEIRTRTDVASVADLKAQGFDAVFIAPGTMKAKEIDIPGKDLGGVVDPLTFLKSAIDSKIDLAGKRVAVVGGGSVAVDSARMALRCGAREVDIYYRRSRKEMPAHETDVQAALDEGVKLHELRAPMRFVGEGGRLTAIALQETKLGAPDASKRAAPEPVAGSETEVAAEVVIVAVGLLPGADLFPGEMERRRDGTLVTNKETLATSLVGVYAARNAIIDPTMIIQSIALGKRAAFHMDRYLRGESEPASFDLRLPRVTHEEVLSRNAITTRAPEKMRMLDPLERARSNAEIEVALSEDAVRAETGRCLDCGICSQCHQCVETCPADAIHFDMRPELVSVRVRSTLLATGFQLFDARRKPLYGYGRHANVVTAMQMDRLLAPTRPYNAVLRPSDGKAPSNIAFVLCTGSRDCTVDSRLCSRVCCMYSIKQAQLLMGALPLAEVTIYFMDIRAFGKGYDEFFEQAKGMGVYFVKGRVAKIEETTDGDLLVSHEDISGGAGKTVAQHDLVVLSVGLTANPKAFSILKDANVEADAFNFVREVDEDLEPGRTTMEGVFVAGTAAGIRDIPDTIVHASAAALQVAAYLRTGEVNQ